MRAGRRIRHAGRCRHRPRQSLRPRPVPAGLPGARHPPRLRLRVQALRGQAQGGRRRTAKPSRAAGAEPRRLARSLQALEPLLDRRLDRSPPGAPHRLGSALPSGRRALLPLVLPRGSRAPSLRQRRHGPGPRPRQALCPPLPRPLLHRARGQRHPAPGRRQRTAARTGRDGGAAARRHGRLPLPRLRRRPDQGRAALHPGPDDPGRGRRASLSGTGPALQERRRDAGALPVLPRGAGRRLRPRRVLPGGAALRQAGSALLRRA